MPSKNNPMKSGYFNVNFFPCLLALSNTQSTHREFSLLMHIYHIYSKKYCHVVDLKHSLVTRWKNVWLIYKTLERMLSMVSSNYLPRVILYVNEVKVFIDDGVIRKIRQTC